MRARTHARTGQVYLRGTLLDGGHLDRCAVEFAAALRSTSSASALFASEPVI